MAIVGGALLGVVLFFLLIGMVLVGGALANRAEKDAILRTERDKAAGLTVDVTSRPGEVLERPVTV